MEKLTAGWNVGEPGVQVLWVIATCKEAIKEEIFNGVVVGVGGAEGAVSFKF